MSQPDDEIELKLEEIRPMPARLRIHMEGAHLIPVVSTLKSYFRFLWTFFLWTLHFHFLPQPVQLIAPRPLKK